VTRKKIGLAVVGAVIVVGAGFRVRVIGPDEYRLDREDNDGRGCESS
jgi:hypothetical protein